MKNKVKYITVFVLCICFSMFFCMNAYADAKIDGIFVSLSGKASLFAQHLRNLAYVISGFGIIMFTFMAIFGKISFKHLGYISISLFILSAMGALIDYVATNDRSKLTYSDEFRDTYERAGTGDLCQSGICR